MSETLETFIKNPKFGRFFEIMNDIHSREIEEVESNLCQAYSNILIIQEGNGYFFDMVKKNLEIYDAKLKYTNNLELFKVLADIEEKYKSYKVVELTGFDKTIVKVIEYTKGLLTLENNLQDWKIYYGFLRNLVILMIALYEEVITFDNVKTFVKEILKRDWLGDDQIFTSCDLVSMFEIVSDDSLDVILLQIIESNTKAVEEYKAGKEKALGSLMGMAIKQCKSSNPADIKNKLITLIGQK